VLAKIALVKEKESRNHQNRDCSVVQPKIDWTPRGDEFRKGMINQAPTEKFKMLRHKLLHPINVATCHGMSNLGFHPHPDLLPSREKEL
jgi:hypothetical protein